MLNKWTNLTSHSAISSLALQSFYKPMLLIYSRSLPGHMAHQENVVKDETEGSRSGEHTHMTHSCSPPCSPGPGWAHHVGHLEMCLTAWETTCILHTFPGKGKGNPGLTHVRNAAALCPDIIASTRSDSWRQAHLPGMAGEGVEGKDMGRGVRHCIMEYVAETCSVTRHYDTMHGVRIEWGLSAPYTCVSPDPLKLSVFAT